MRLSCTSTRSPCMQCPRACEGLLRTASDDDRCSRCSLLTLAQQSRIRRLRTQAFASFADWPSNMNMDIRPVSQLAAPRGAKLVDELSGRPATLRRVVHGQDYYYSDMHSLELDASVIDEIGTLLCLIAAEKVASGSEEERAIHKCKMVDYLKQAVSITKTMAEKRLLARDFEHANPAALRCLKLSIELFGPSSLEIIPANLLLADACVGIGRGEQANEFIAQAELQLTNATSTPPTLMARLHMLKGKVLEERGELSSAIRSFAKTVYYTSRADERGPEHHSCGSGFYHLGHCFAAQQRWEQAMANYDKCVDVWYKSLVGVKGSMARQMLALADEEARMAGKPLPSTRAEQGMTGGGTAGISSTTGLPRLEPVEADEAVEQLVDIEGTRVGQLGEGHVSVSEVRYTRALVLAAKADIGAASQLLEKTVENLLAALGPDHPTTQDAAAYLGLFKQVQAARQEESLSRSSVGFHLG